MHRWQDHEDKYRPQRELAWLVVGAAALYVAIKILWPVVFGWH